LTIEQKENIIEPANRETPMSQSAAPNPQGDANRGQLEAATDQAIAAYGGDARLSRR
jgi:hypothetical protein